MSQCIDIQKKNNLKYLNLSIMNNSDIKNPSLKYKIYRIYSIVKARWRGPSQRALFSAVRKLARYLNKKKSGGVRHTKKNPVLQVKNAFNYYWRLGLHSFLLEKKNYFQKKIFKERYRYFFFIFKAARREATVSSNNSRHRVKEDFGISFDIRSNH